MASARPSRRPGAMASLSAALLIVTQGLLPSLGRGQAPADVDPFHWGYAPMFGSGHYRQSDGTEVRIARVRPAITLREPEVRWGPNFGVRLLLPFTVGVQGLDDDDLPPGRSSDGVEQAAVLPGLELELENDRYALRVYGQLGWGTELDGEENAALMGALGLRSRLAWPDAPGRPALISGLLWAGFEPDVGERGSLLRLTQGLEFDVPVPGWRFRDAAMHLRPHVLADWYYRPPPALAFGDEDFRRVETEWQLGLSAGREGGFQILWFELDAVGVAYRFSEHSAGLRFVINSIF